MASMSDRRPVGITAAAGIVYVACADGSVWFRQETGEAGAGDWRELPPIPGSDRESSADS